MADEPVSAHRESRLNQLRRWARHHKPLVAIAATAVVVLTVTLSVMWGVRSRALAQSRSDVQSLHAAAIAAAEADDLDRAISHLSQAAGLCEGWSTLSSLRGDLLDEESQLEKYEAFRGKAKATLAVAAHGFGARVDPDPLALQCRDALQVYQILDDHAWYRQLEGRPLSSQQSAEVRGMAADRPTTVSPVAPASK